MTRFASLLLSFLLAGAFGPAALCLANEAQQQVLERYKEILLQTPRKGAVFERVYGHYADTGQSANLYQELLSETQNNPNDAKTWILLGLVAERRNRSELAAEAFQHAANLEPETPLPLLYLGELQLNQRRVYEAIAALEQAHERLQNHSGSRTERRAVLQTLALAYSRFGKPQKSLEVWNQLADLFPNDPDILVQVAESMESDGKLNEALRQYRRLIDMTDDNFERVRLSLAAIDIMLRLGDDEAALRDLDSLLGFLHRDSYLADAVRDRIDRIFERGRNPLRHIEFYQQRIEHDPNDTVSLLRLVRIFQQTDRSAEAETLLRDTLRVSPANIALRLMLIDLLVARRDITGAIEQFQAIDRTAPPPIDTLIRWGTLVLQNPAVEESARRTEAAGIWNRIAENSPNDPTAAVLVADLFARNRFYDEAQRLYQHAVTLRPNEFAYRESLAAFYHQQRQKEKMLETLFPTDNQSFTERNRSEIGQFLLSWGYNAEAAEILREAVQANPQNWTLHYRYLESLLRQDTPKSEQAIRELFAHAEKQIIEDEQFSLFLYQTVQLLRSEQRLAEAVKIVQSSLETAPAVRSLWHLAVLHQAGANYPAAIAAFERISESEAQPPALLRFAAELYEQSGDTNRAIALYRMLVQSDPARSGEHWQRIITLQIQRGELSQALETSRNLLGRGTENAERLRFVADLFLSAHRRVEAIGLLRQALVHEPGNADVLRLLAQTLADSEQPEEAIELFWRLYERLEHFPAKLSVIEILATEYNKLGRDEDLVEHLQLLSRQHERRREAMQALVRVFILQGDYGEAQNVLEDLLDLPDEGHTDGEFASHWVLRELIGLAERQNDLATAVRYQETLAQRSNDPQEQNHLFYLYDKLGDTAKARRLFFDQVLRQGNWEPRIELIDTMIRRGQYDIVSQVLDFLEMHEPEHWQIAFRRILIEALQNKPVERLVQEFRTMRADESVAAPIASVRNNHPTFIFFDVAPAALNDSLILQNQFLPILFHGGTRPPAAFPEIESFQDARFVSLGFLLREAINKDVSARFDNEHPNAMRHLRKAVDELREMLSADSTEYDVLMERLRLEVWLLDLRNFNSQYREVPMGVLHPMGTLNPAGLLETHIDERVCQQTIMQLIRNVALDGAIDWQPALFQILIAESINEIVAERFNTVLPSDARLSEKLSQILDDLCFELKTPPMNAEEREQMIRHAAYLVKQSAAEQHTELHSQRLSLSQKTDRLLTLWKEFIENVSPEARAKYGDSFASRYGTLHWIIRSQNRDADVTALEESLRTAAQSDPLWFAENIANLTKPNDENKILFGELSNYVPLEMRLQRIKSGAADVFPFCKDRETQRAFCETIMRHLLFSLSLHLHRYDIFTPPERGLFALSAPQLWNYLLVQSQSQRAQFVRQLFGVAPPVPSHVQMLNSDQMNRLVELDRSLRLFAGFAVEMLDEFKLTPSDFVSALPAPAAQNVSLIRYRSELQGDRPLDRTIIYSLMRDTQTSGNFAAVDELFFRILLLRRAMDVKTQYLAVRIDDRVMLIRENYTETHRQFLENKQQSSVPLHQSWGNHLSATFGDLLQRDEQAVTRPEQGSDAELLYLVQKLESADGERTTAEQLALALLYVRLQRFDDVIAILDSMALTTSSDLLTREWIIADLAMKRAGPGTPLAQRGSEAVERLSNFRLSERDALYLVPMLNYYDREAEANRILEHLAITISDRRLLAELFNRVLAMGEPHQENAARIARRILMNPAFLQTSRRLTADVFLMESAIRVLREQEQLESVVPVLENRLRGHRDGTDSRILLARFYLVLGRQVEARELALELAQNPTLESERRQMITSLLSHFGLQRELESMNRLLLEERNRQ